MNGNARTIGTGVRTMETLHNGEGKLLASSDVWEKNVIGEVEIVYESRLTGKRIFTHKLYKNDLLITGAVFLTEKVNNMRSSFITTPVDVSLGVHDISEVDNSVATVPKEQICCIMVGNGGCGDTHNAVHKVHKTDYTVPSPVPFRVVHKSADLTGVQRMRYMLRVERGEYVYYYGKRFTVEPEINVMYEDGTTVPTNVNVLGDVKGQYIKTFTKYMAVIDENDIREFFKLTQGSTLRSVVNSIGLITGYIGSASDSEDKGTDIPEIFNARTMTTLNTEDDALKDSESTITYIYRQYFV